MNSIHLDRITIPKIGLDRLSLPRFGVPESEGLALPPELKKSLVCWYSPRKQGLTEYDVIESYVTDFKNWNYLSGSATISIAANKLTITEVFNDSRIIHTNKNIFQSIDLYITGVEDGINLIYHNDLSTNEVTLHNGINRVSIKNAYNYVYVKGFTGECNITIEQLPTSTAKDYSGNGYDLYLRGFQGKLNSGIGVYKHDFTTWIVGGDIVEKTPFFIKKRFNNTVGGYRLLLNLRSNVSIESFKVKIAITGTYSSNKVDYLYITENGDSASIVINNGEEVVVPKSYAISGSSTYVGFQFYESGNDDCEITITQIPDYPNQLCHSGKEYSVAYELPLLDDYTVIIKRKRIATNRIVHDRLSSKYNIYNNKINGAFHLEQKGDNADYNFERTQSYGAWNSIVIDNNNDIVYQTKHEYNGTPLRVVTVDDGSFLEIGKSVIGCWSDYLLFDRTLTNEEINYVKYNLIDTAPAPRPDVYYDMSRKNNDSPTRNIIEDLSGNGRNAEIFNMAYALGSGYGKYPIALNRLWCGSSTQIICTSTSIVYKKGYTGYSGVRIMVKEASDKTMVVHFKVEGLKGGYMLVGYSGLLPSDIDYSEKHYKDGYFDIEVPAKEFFQTGSFITISPRNEHGGIENVDGTKLTLLPSEYEGALVFDGIDDKAVISNATKGFKTLFMEVVPMNYYILYDQRVSLDNHNFSIYANKGSIAYNDRNNGKSYINGKLNDSLKVDDLQGKRQVITIVNPNAKGVSNIYIGCGINNNYNANMALYKLIGFYDELTPEEIKKVIYKYKLNYEKL